MHSSAQTHYQAELNAGRFSIQHCPQCAQHVFPPRELCPYCGADRLQWVLPSGCATVYSTSTVARKSDAGGDYNVALIDLDEGVRMMARVDGVPPEAVRIGQRVRAHLVQAEGGGLVLYRPETEGGKA